MEMVELEIELNNELITKIRNLALRYFGDDTDASLARVLEVAFRMRRLWSCLVISGQGETDEAMTTWEYPPSQAKQENNGTIQNWLFRR